MRYKLSSTQNRTKIQQDILHSRYTHLDRSALRTSAFPTIIKNNLLSDENVNLQFLAALAYASESMANAIKLMENTPISLKKRRKIERAHYLYQLRAAFRSTPFGLFSAVGSVPITDHSCLSSQNARFIEIRNSDSVIEWKKMLNHSKSEPSSYFWTTNSTTYMLGHSVRYLNWIDEIPPIMIVIPRHQNLDLLLKKARTKISYETLTEIVSKSWNESQTNAQIRLAYLIKIGLFIPISFDNETCSAITSNAKFKYVHLQIKEHHLSLGRAEALRVAEVCELLGRLLPNKLSPLSALRTGFINRWGDSDVPLLELFDPETGIDISGEQQRLFGSYMAKHNLTTEDHSPVNELTTHNETNKLLEQSIKNQCIELDLSSLDISKLLDKAPSRWPQSLTALFTLEQNEKFEKTRIWFKTAAGPDANRLLVQFADNDSTLEDMIQKVAEFNQQANRNAIHAEVSFILNDGFDSTMGRLNPYNNTLVCNGHIKSGHAIKLNDVFVRLINKEFQLFDVSTGIRIIPHISHPIHLDSPNHPNILRFLALLATQPGFRSLRWTWGTFAAHDKLPRLIWKDIVISPRRWRIETVKIQGKELSEIQNYLLQLDIPNFVEMYGAFGESLPLDLTDDRSIDVLKHIIIQKGFIELAELPCQQFAHLNLRKKSYAYKFALPLIFKH